MKRKRGAQAGNRNAFKHGFYTKTFRQMDGELLSSGKSPKFEGEIDLIRGLMKLTMDKANEQSSLSLEETLSLLRNVSFAAAIIERLSRAGGLERSQIHVPPPDEG